MGDGPAAAPPVDRFGRDAHRHPMQWDATPTGGFTTGVPWLPPIDPAARNVADQDRDPGSMLALYRDLIALRRELTRRAAAASTPRHELVAFARGDHLIAVNAGERPAPAARRRGRAARAMGRPAAHIAPGEGLIARRICLKAALRGIPGVRWKMDVNGRGDRWRLSRG